MKRLLLLVILILTACQPSRLASTPTPSPSPPKPTPTTTPTQTASPTQTPASTITPTDSPSYTPTPVFSVCSPLEDETFESLPLILANPLAIPPHFGMDTGHHGVDFAYYRRGERPSIQGIEIYAVMAGRVVLALVDDDVPYGYALLIETQLADLPKGIQEDLLTNYQQVPEDPNYRLYCPEVPSPNLTGEYAVYHLYAHMEQPPNFQTGDFISCGQTLGTVGNSGYSSNPHLHLETRLGPAGAHFASMAHYENTNTPEQMGNYCLWRMSGYYQLFDPFVLFNFIQ